MDALNRHLRSEAGIDCARIVEKVKGAGENDDMEYDSLGVVEKSEEQKHHLIPKRRQSGGGGGGADSWSGVAL